MFDPETLRDCPDDPDTYDEQLADQRSEVESARDRLEQAPVGDISSMDNANHVTDGLYLPEETRLAVTRLGRQLNRLRDLLSLSVEPSTRWREALAVGSEALGIWQSLRRTKATFLARLHRAELAFDVLDPQRALDTLNQLVTRSEDEQLAPYRDFALETRGLCRWRHGADQSAVDDIEASLTIRRERGNDRLIDRCETILERITRNT